MDTDSQFQSKNMQTAIEVYYAVCYGRELGTLEHMGTEDFRSTPLTPHIYRPLGGFTPRIARLTLVMLDHRVRK